MTVPDMAVSNMFILTDRYVRVDAPDDSEFAGFWCDVRQNLSNGDRRILIDRLDELGAAASDEIEASRQLADAIRAQLVDGVPPDEQRALIRQLGEMTDRMETLADQAVRDQWALVAPYVRDWNAYQGDPPERIPPPAEGGVESMDAVTRDMSNWIVREVLQAYRSGKGVTKRSTPPGASGLPMGGPKASSNGASASPSQAHRKSSSGRSASRSKT